MKGSLDFLIGAAHVLSHGLPPLEKQLLFDKNSMPIYWHFAPDSSIALVPKKVVNLIQADPLVVVRGSMKEREYGMWVLGEDGSVENAALLLGKEHVMRSIFPQMAKETLQDLNDLRAPFKHFVSLATKPYRSTQ